MTAAKLLMTQDTDAANALAAELCELNRRRQSIETGIWEEANAILAGKIPDAPSSSPATTGIRASSASPLRGLPSSIRCPP